jgi:hypothetical protein
MANLLHPLSTPTTLPVFDVFGVPPTQIAVDRGWFSTHFPSSTADSTQLLEFDFMTSNTDYIHMDRMILKLKLKITPIAKDILIDGKPAKNNLTDAMLKDIALINYPIETIFAQKDLYISGKAVTTSETTNSFRTIIDTKLGFSNTAKNGWMTAGLYNNDSNTGLLYEHSNKYIKNNREIDLMGILHFDLAFQDKALIGGPRFTVKLHPHSPDFYLKWVYLMLK